MNVQEVLGFSMNSVGIWAIIDVDESIPFFKIPKPEFSKHLFQKMKLSDLVKSLDTKFLGAYSSKNNLWVNYLEKAYAKLNEGYFNICNNGVAAHALTDLTSAPCRVLQLSPKTSTQNLKE